MMSEDRVAPLVTHYSSIITSDSAAAEGAVHHPPGVEVGDLVLDGVDRLGAGGLGAFPAEGLPGLHDLRLALLLLALAVPVADVRGREVLAVLVVDALEVRGVVLRLAHRLAVGLEPEVAEEPAHDLRPIPGDEVQAHPVLVVEAPEVLLRERAGLLERLGAPEAGDLRDRIVQEP